MLLKLQPYLTISSLSITILNANLGIPNSVSRLFFTAMPFSQFSPLMFMAPLVEGATGIILFLQTCGHFLNHHNVHNFLYVTINACSLFFTLILALYLIACCC